LEAGSSDPADTGRRGQRERSPGSVSDAEAGNPLSHQVHVREASSLERDAAIEVAEPLKPREVFGGYPIRRAQGREDARRRRPGYRLNVGRRNSTDTSQAVAWSRSRMQEAQRLQFGPQRLPVVSVDCALCGFLSREGVFHGGLILGHGEGEQGAFSGNA